MKSEDSTLEAVKSAKQQAKQEVIFKMQQGMATFGGSFVKALAQALAYASSEKKERILKAFPEYTVERYGPGTPFYTDVLSQLEKKEQGSKTPVTSYQTEIKNTAYKMAKALTES